MSRLKNAIVRKLSQGIQGRVLPRSRYGNYPSPVAAIQTAEVINTGSASPFNTERKLHRNSIKIRVKVPEAASVAARLVITAGDHEAKTVNGVNFANHLLKDGTNTYKGANGSTDVAGVVVTASFGISAVESVKNFQDFVRNKGLLVSSSRYKFLTDDQLLNKIHFNQFDYLGDHGIDFIDPEIEHDPAQYHDKDILMPLEYVLNEDTIMMIDVEPGETIQLTMYMSKFQDLTRMLVNQARREGSNVLL